MGQQQLLLAVLGMVLLGVAIAVGVTMFQSNAAESSRNAIIGDLLFYAGRARECYWKPKVLGGVDHDFSGITIRMLAARTENANGRYYIESASKDELIIVGVGRVVSDYDTIEVKMHVNEHQNLIEIVH